MSDVPKPPRGLRASGKALWIAVLDDFDLNEHEVAILRECCRTVDGIDALQRQLDADGVMGESSQGVRVHPALVELRQQRVAFARLVAALRIPVDDVSGRPQNRAGARGVYAISGSA